MSRLKDNKKIKYNCKDKTVTDNIVTLLYTYGLSSLKAITSLSQSREVCSREKKRLLDNKYITEVKRQRRNKERYKVNIVKASKKLKKEIGTQIPNIDFDKRFITKFDSKNVYKRLISGELMAHFLRMKEDIYLGESLTPNIDKNHFVPYIFANEYLRGETELNHDTKVKLICGLYITPDMKYPMYHIPDNRNNFYYISKKSDYFIQSHVRRVPKQTTNIIYLMGKQKHKHMLKGLIQNEEIRGGAVSKFYRFFIQPNDTYLIPAGYDGTYELTKLATLKEFSEKVKSQIEDRMENAVGTKFYYKNHFEKDKVNYIYMPVIKVNEIRKIINNIKDNNYKNKEIYIGIITLKENIDLLIEYIKEVLVNQNHKKVTLKIINDMSDFRERKNELKEDTFILE